MTPSWRRFVRSVFASRVTRTARARPRGADTSPISRRAMADLERRLEEEGGRVADTWPPSTGTYPIGRPS